MSCNLSKITYKNTVFLKNDFEGMPKEEIRSYFKVSSKNLLRVTEESLKITD